MRERNAEEQLDDAFGAAGKRIASSPRDARTDWLVGELATVRQAFRRSSEAFVAADTLGHLLYFRLVTEVAIRLAWIAQHRFEPNRTGQAVDAMLKRDLLTFGKAAERTGGRPNEEAARQAAQIRVSPAPRELDTLATAGDAIGAYRYFRLCSAMIHPGVGRRVLRGFPPDMTHREAQAYAVQCLANADEALDAVGAYAETTDDVDAVLSSAAFFFYSPVVLSARLGRDLRRGGQRVRIADSSVELRSERGQETMTTMTVTVLDDRGKRAVSASSADPDEIYPRLLAAARSER